MLLWIQLWPIRLLILMHTALLRFQNSVVMFFRELLRAHPMPGRLNTEVPHPAAGSYQNPSCCIRRWMDWILVTGVCMTLCLSCSHQPRAKLLIEPSKLDFGSVEQYSEREARLAVSNTGN